MLRKQGYKTDEIFWAIGRIMSEYSLKYGRYNESEDLAKIATAVGCAVLLLQGDEDIKSQVEKNVKWYRSWIRKKRKADITYMKEYLERQAAAMDNKALMHLAGQVALGNVNRKDAVLMATGALHNALYDEGEAGSAKRKTRKG